MLRMKDGYRVFMHEIDRCRHYDRGILASTAGNLFLSLHFVTLANSAVALVCSSKVNAMTDCSSPRGLEEKRTNFAILTGCVEDSASC